MFILSFLVSVSCRSEADNLFSGRGDMLLHQAWLTMQPQRVQKPTKSLFDYEFVGQPHPKLPSWSSHTKCISHLHLSHRSISIWSHCGIRIYDDIMTHSRKWLNYDFPSLNSFTCRPKKRTADTRTDNRRSCRSSNNLTDFKVFRQIRKINLV